MPNKYYNILNKLLYKPQLQCLNLEETGVYGWCHALCKLRTLKNSYGGGGGSICGLFYGKISNLNQYTLIILRHIDLLALIPNNLY